MDMRSKKISSNELDTLRRSRNPTVALTANGEVGANEEASIRSRSKSIRGRASSRGNASSLVTWETVREWVRGQKARLTKEEKTIECETDNFVPLVVSRVVHQFWKQFVVNINIAGFVNMSSSRAK